MKRSYVVVLAAVLFFTTGVSAQTKIGFIRINDIVGLMPELAQDKVNMDTVGAQFVKDSIMPTVNLKQDQYNNLLKEYTDTVKNSAQVRSVIEKELKDLQSELSGVDNYIQQVLQEKQQEFLRPYYAKAKKAIDAVAKEKGYTHVLNTDVFLIAPESDDMSIPVLTKLGIKLPTQPATKTPAPAPKTGK
ncbi:MAG: OmpH family outer membrane protein [Chitinophagaceae bacterium]|nr:OmpH family outer membrane protein [Chitinophagaceae bacterium]